MQNLRKIMKPLMQWSYNYKLVPTATIKFFRKHLRLPIQVKFQIFPEFFYLSIYRRTKRFQKLKKNTSGSP